MTLANRIRTRHYEPWEVTTARPHCCYMFHDVDPNDVWVVHRQEPSFLDHIREDAARFSQGARILIAVSLLNRAQISMDALGWV